MNHISKTNWYADETRVHVTLPLTKVDRENRLVSGFATLDNVDLQGDIVTADASKSAFSRFRGNIREMHDNIAAGKLIDFAEEKYYAPEEDKWYDGIFVTAYVSKGAPNTWEKVLDGTLTGFSIGGNIKKAQSVFDKATRKTVRVVEDFDLAELSLVDSPANQLANIVSVTKSDGGVKVEGELADMEISNVFWCDEDQIARVSEQEKLSCAICNDDMQAIGWIEGTDTTEIAAVVNKFIKAKPSEGGVTMGKKNTDELVKTDEVEEEKPTSLATDVDAPDESGEEAAASGAEASDEVETTEVPDVETVDDVPTSDPDLEKMLDDVRNAVEKTVETTQDVSAKVTAIEGQLEEISKSYADTVEKTEKKISELETKLDSVHNETEKFLKRIDALEGATAMKKSVDTEDETVTKSEGGVWNGSIFR